MKLFRVKKVTSPEWGRDQVEFTRYFFAGQKETVETVVRDRYGKSGWFAYDREEVRYEIEELDVETL